MSFAVVTVRTVSEEGGVKKSGGRKKKKKEDEFRFDLDTGEIVLHFRAASMTELQNWIRALEAASQVLAPESHRNVSVLHSQEDLPVAKLERKQLEEELSKARTLAKDFDTRMSSLAESLEQFNAKRTSAGDETLQGTVVASGTATKQAGRKLLKHTTSLVEMVEEQ